MDKLTTDFYNWNKFCWLIWYPLILHHSRECSVLDSHTLVRHRFSVYLNLELIVVYGISFFLLIWSALLQTSLFCLFFTASNCHWKLDQFTTGFFLVFQIGLLWIYFCNHLASNRSYLKLLVLEVIKSHFGLHFVCEWAICGFLIKYLDCFYFSFISTNSSFSVITAHRLFNYFAILTL